MLAWGLLGMLASQPMVFPHAHRQQDPNVPLAHLMRLRPRDWLRSRIRASAAAVSMPIEPRLLRISVVFSRPRVLCLRGITGLDRRAAHSRGSSRQNSSAE